MKRSETQKIKTVLDDFMDQHPYIAQRLAETRLLSSWSKTLGPGVSRFTDNLFIRDRVLYVKLTSSVLKSELMMCRERLIKSLNHEARLDVIDSIRFL